MTEYELPASHKCWERVDKRAVSQTLVALVSSSRRYLEWNLLNNNYPEWAFAGGFKACLGNKACALQSQVSEYHPCTRSLPPISHRSTNMVTIVGDQSTFLLASSLPVSEMPFMAHSFLLVFFVFKPHNVFQDASGWSNRKPVSN